VEIVVRVMAMVMVMVMVMARVQIKGGASELRHQWYKWLSGQSWR